MREAIERVRAFASKRIISGALSIYRRGEFYLSKTGTAYFMVRGSTGFHTAYIDLKHGKCGCSCIGFISHRACKHIVALLFNLYFTSPKLFKLGARVVEANKLRRG